MNATPRFEASRVLFLALAVALTAVPALAQDAARGEELYSLCAQCHGEDGGGRPEALAPAIAGLPAWFVTGQLQKFRNGGRGTHFDDISGMRMRPMSMWLANDQDVANVAAFVSSLPKVNPAPTLGGGGFTFANDEDVANVAAFVSSLPKVNPAPTLEGGNAEAGKQKYVPCIACHGMNGEGNQALNAPPLAGTSDWYQLTSLQKFKAGVRGTNPKDTTGMLMRPMSMTLADEQAMLDVIAYIATLNPAN